MALIVPTPNMYRGRLNPLTYVVWHATVSSEVTGGAHNVAAGWFAKPQAQASAHIVADDGADRRYPDGIVECVPPGDTAWHAASANSRGYGVEVVGQAAQSGAQWRDRYSLAAIGNAARWVREHPALQHIPARWLSDAELRRGTVPGHVTHAQVSRVLGGDHWDPGPHFPFDYLMACLAGEEDQIDMTPEQLAAAVQAGVEAALWRRYAEGRNLADDAKEQTSRLVGIDADGDQILARLDRTNELLAQLLAEGGKA